MNALLYFLLWGAFVFLMLRFGCGSHVMGRGQGHAEHAVGEQKGRGDSGALRWIPPPKDVDPVCGKTVGTDKAKPSVFDGSVYYFCSRECREIFEAAPEQYIGPQAAEPQPQLENARV